LSKVGSDWTRRYSWIVETARSGKPGSSWTANGDVDFLVVDERTPRDRVYALSGHRVAPAVIDELIGNDRIGRQGDMPGTDEAIRAFILGEPAPKPKLTLIQREDKQ
jgi:hypothetical protein